MATSTGSSMVYAIIVLLGVLNPVPFWILSSSQEEEEEVEVEVKESLHHRVYPNQQHLRGMVNYYCLLLLG